MLKPGEIERLPKELEKLMSDLEINIMDDIIRRIKINSEITRSADWQINRLIELGQSDKYVKEQIQQALKLSEAEIDELYTKAYSSEYARNKTLYEAVGKPQIPFEKNYELQQTIQAVIAQTKAEMVNITQSLGFAVNMYGDVVFTPLATYYQKILDDSIFGIVNGAFDYNTAIKKCIKDMVRSGIRTVDYQTGWHNRIVVASRRAVITGISQITGKVNEQMAAELETDKYEVSWHATARPSHQAWQGKVFTMEQLKSVCGLGDVRGLCGANCRHSYSPFIEGVSERTYTDEELAEMNAKENETTMYAGREYTSYEATQRMRRMETNMRAQREQIKLFKRGGATQETIDELTADYRITSAQYADFAKTMKLPQERARVYMDGLGRVANRYQNDIAIYKSLGSAARNYPVRLPDGTLSKLQEGTKITKVYSFAGKGAKKEIRIANKLEKEYNVSSSEWKKVRGDGYVLDANNKVRHAELHWYETKETGRVDMKVKRYFDES